MFLSKRRASPFQWWNVSVRLKIVRLSSLVCRRKAEVFFFLFCWSLETSLQKILGIKNTGCGHRENIFCVCYAKILCSGNQDEWSSEELVQTSAVVHKCCGYHQSSRCPGRARVIKDHGVVGTSLPFR